MPTLEGPAEYRPAGEPIAAGHLLWSRPGQHFASHLRVEASGPTLPARDTQRPLPDPLAAARTAEAPHPQHQVHRPTHDAEVAHRALAHPLPRDAERSAVGADDAGSLALEFHSHSLGAGLLPQDAELWNVEQSFCTSEVQEHGDSLLWVRRFGHQTIQGRIPCLSTHLLNPSAPFPSVLHPGPISGREPSETPSYPILRPPWGTGAPP